ncbi:MAG TPA: TolC family protein [Vicinamibacteria bacterium]|nr:TolC family protein [Vicinamibacteria bacterium]
MRLRIRAAAGLLAVIALFTCSSVQAQVQPPPAAPPAVQPQTQLQLGLDEAVKRALDNNTDIAVSRYDPELSQQNVVAAKGYYDPYLFSNLSYASQKSPGTSFLSGGTKVDTTRDVWNFGGAVPIEPTGATFQVTFNNNKQDTTSTFSFFNPTYSSGLNLSLTQPLLRNLQYDSARQQIYIAKKNREMSDVQFHATIINTVATVKGYYYDLVYAFDNLDAARQNLGLAQRLLNENQIRVKVGTMAPLDVVQAQSEVAARETDVITAENQLAQAQDNLKQAIFPANDPATWAIQIQPTDHPGADPVPVDLDAAVRIALQNRTDVVNARKNLEIADYNVKYNRSQLLPQLDLVAAWGAAGAGGPQIRDANGPLVPPIPGGYGDAVSQVFGADFPTWTVGANISYSIPNRSYKAAAASARISRDQAQAAFRRLELQIAAEVRTAGRAVETGFKTVESSKAARILAEQRLDAEEKKFAAGMSTNFLVTQAQRDLALQRVIELTAISNYHKSIVNFQRTQEAGLTAAGNVAVLSSSASSNQAAAAIRSSAAAASVGSTGGF